MVRLEYAAAMGGLRSRLERERVWGRCETVEELLMMMIKVGTVELEDILPCSAVASPGKPPAGSIRNTRYGL